MVTHVAEKLIFEDEAEENDDEDDESEEEYNIDEEKFPIGFAS